MTRAAGVISMVLLISLQGAWIEAATWYVDARICPNAGSGTLASPYCDIQTAVAGAQAGDVVKVAAGVYSTKHSCPLSPEAPVVPNPATAVVCMRDQVHLEGAGAGSSILDALGADRVVVFDQVGPGTRLQGFTVTGGDIADRFGDGGGLLVLFSSPTITRNHVVGNRAFFGGGVSVLYSAPLIQDNVIEENWAGGDQQSSTGAGIDVAFSSNPVITRNFIVGNYVDGSGGGLAFYETDGSADSNRIEGNVAELNGGGVFSAPIANLTSGHVVLRSNVIGLNVARAADGGGVFASEGTDVLLGTISHNRAILGDGGGVFTIGSASILLRDSLLYRNGAVNGGGAFFDPTSRPSVSGNDAYENLPANYGGSMDPGGSFGNFSAEPMLLNVPGFVTETQIDRFFALVVPVDPEPSRQFAVGDVVEYGDDGIPRIVTLIRTAVGVPLIKLETDPILTELEILPYPVVLRRWGANPRLREDFSTSVLSPLVDAVGMSNTAPPVDALGRPRQFDGNLDGQTRMDVGAIESLAELPAIDISPDGTVAWATFPTRPWHHHLYRGPVSGLVDLNKDGVPDGPDRAAGTADDGYGSCLVPGVPLFGTGHLDPEIPAPGAAFFYLGTLGDASEGVLGFDSAGRQRVNVRPCG